MTRSARILLGDILEAAELLERYTAGLTRQEFAGNIAKQDARGTPPRAEELAIELAEVFKVPG